MKPVLFLIIHGVQYGRLSEAYAAEFIDSLEQRIPAGKPVYIR